MPRPKRDYGAVLKTDIATLDRQIAALQIQRDALQAMLTALETVTKNNNGVRAVLAPAATRARSRRGQSLALGAAT